MTQNTYDIQKQIEQTVTDGRGYGCRRDVELPESMKSTEEGLQYVLLDMGRIDGKISLLDTVKASVRMITLAEKLDVLSIPSDVITTAGEYDQALSAADRYPTLFCVLAPILERRNARRDGQEFLKREV